MHYFFLEKFREPSEWYLRRLTYTRSVAANSMVRETERERQRERERERGLPARAR
jgi:hypothetical protein